MKYCSKCETIKYYHNTLWRWRKRRKCFNNVFGNGSMFYSNKERGEQASSSAFFIILRFLNAL